MCPLPEGEHTLGPLSSVRGIRSLPSVWYRDDFLGAGAVVIPAAGSAESGVDWVKGITGAAPPTVAGVADFAGGAVASTLTSASQAQNAALYHGDQRGFLVTNGGILDGRFKVPVLPTSLGKLVFGLAGDLVADPDSITHSIWVAVTSAGILVETDDNATDNSVDTGIDIVADDIVAVKIDYTRINDIRFYIAVNPTAGEFVPWRRVARTTTFAFAATGASATLQPYMTAAKASGAGVGTAYWDAIEINNRR